MCLCTKLNIYIYIYIYICVCVCYTHSAYPNINIAQTVSLPALLSPLALSIHQNHSKNASVSHLPPRGTVAPACMKVLQAIAAPVTPTSTSACPKVQGLRGQGLEIRGPGWASSAKLLESGLLGISRVLGSKCKLHPSLDWIL